MAATVRDPWSSMNPAARKRLFLTSTLLLLGLSVAMIRIDVSLRTEAAPNGIVDFELAGTVERSGEILRSWSQAAREDAMLSHGLDYLYMIVYSLWFSIACAGLGRARDGVLATSGVALAWLVLLCVPLDAIENRALIVQMYEGAEASAAALARACAIPKFVLVFAATAYLIAVGLTSLVARRSA